MSNQRVVETTTVHTTTTTTGAQQQQQPQQPAQPKQDKPMVTHVYGEAERKAMATTTDPKAPVPVALPAAPDAFSMAGNRLRTLDQDMQAVLEEFAKLDPKPIETLTPSEARKQPTIADAVEKVMKHNKLENKPHRGLSVSNKSHDNVKLRFYTPEKTTKDSHLPIVIYFRGGGYVIADLDVYDHAPASLARLLGCCVISVDYPMAPEHKFPAAHEAAFEAYRYISENAVQWGYSNTHFALIGESAGGNLAIATAIAVRDSTVTPKPCAIVAVYPVAATLDTNKPSMTEDAHAKPLNSAMLTWFFNSALPNEAARADPRLNLVAANLAGLPPTTLISADVDPLRSDADLLAHKLRHAGVETHHDTFKGVVHEFFGIPRRVVAKAGVARDLAAQRIREGFGRAPGAVYIKTHTAAHEGNITEQRTRVTETRTVVG